MRKKKILQVIAKHPNLNQRQLAEKCGYSLGLVNKLVSQLVEEKYITQDFALLPLAHKEFDESSPKNAIILAAGCGMRMIPVNMEIPKGIIEINGEPLIERIIHQLHDVGIYNITIVVGFMKEKYDYLIDQYHVDLVVNPEYARKNNLYSLSLARDKICNTYIIPCDIWCGQNPFNRNELFSWYMVNDLVENESTVRVNRKMELVKTDIGVGGNGMLGICYLMGEQAAIVRERLFHFSNTFRYYNEFWEETLFNKDKMIVYANVVHFTDVVEINTYEQLREFDSNSSQLNNATMKVICNVLNVKQNEITDIEVLKKGMTNRSFLFQCNGKKYIMRIPGEGTDRLINRRGEMEVYQKIQNEQICDDIVYINLEDGYKITVFWENARVCNPNDWEDVTKCMKLLRRFHDAQYQVEHEFDLFGQIQFYETLWNGSGSFYKDYEKTKKNIFSLKHFLEKYSTKKCLTHIDAVPDNFLFLDADEDSKTVRLIDWEYAGMQDPHVDIAMFAIYSMYDREQIDQLIDIYFEQNCSMENRTKIYCYVAICGLLWSNWCEYKAKLGVEFGEYSLKQYRYAKDYYRIVQNIIEESGEDGEVR